MNIQADDRQMNMTNHKKFVNEEEEAKASYDDESILPPDDKIKR